LAKPLLIFLVWWVLVNLLATAAFFRYRLTEPDTALAWIPPESGFFPARWQGFVDLHMRWDSGFYVWIAADGYYPDNAAFAPLYPWLIRAVERPLTWLTGIDFDWWAWSGVAFAVANLSAASVAVLIYVLARVDLGETDALRAVVMMLASPAAFFLTCVYSEALFLALVLAAFWAARLGRWALAGLLGALCALTRVTGVVLLLPLAVEFVQARRDGRSWTALLWLLLIPAALLAFEAMLRARGLSFLATQATRYGRPLALGGWQALVDLAHYAADHPPAMVNLMLDVAANALALVIAIVACWRVRLSYGLFAILALWLPARTGPTTVRYTLPAFVAPLALARWGRNVWIERGALAVGLLLQGLYAALFVQGYWAG
jgi:hypothetical protein